MDIEALDITTNPFPTKNTSAALAPLIKRKGYDIFAFAMATTECGIKILNYSPSPTSMKVFDPKS